jgi:hypothetical protein
MDLHSVGLYGTEPLIDDDGNAPLLRSTLAGSVEGAGLDKFRDTVGKIMTLLGRTKVAEEWGLVSVLLPLAEHWRQETDTTNSTRARHNPTRTPIDNRALGEERCRRLYLQWSVGERSILDPRRFSLLFANFLLVSTAAFTTDPDWSFAL